MDSSLGLLGQALNYIDSRKRAVGNQIMGLLGNPVDQINQWLGQGADWSRGVEANARDAQSVVPGVRQEGWSNMANTLLNSGGILAPTVYHGTPHQFSRYDLSKIGTGEGAQAYGHGIYFAENPAVAKQYADALSQGRNAVIEGSGTKAEIPAWLATSIEQNGIDSAIKDWSQRVKDAAAELKTSQQPWLVQEKMQGLQSTLDALKKIKDAPTKNIVRPNHLLQQELPDEVLPRMLQWDKPLSEQPEAVQKAFQSLGFDTGSTKFADNNAWHKAASKYLRSAEASKLVNSDLYAAENIYAARKAWNRGPDSMKEYLDGPDGGWLRGVLTGAKGGDMSGGTALGKLMDKNGGYGAMIGQGGGQMAAAEKLRSLGIPGLSYLDAGSRSGGKGTMNHVIWDQDLLDKMIPTPVK